MGLLELLQCVTPAPPALASHDDTTATFECDYDAGPTSLYQAIENKAWVPVLEFFETGKWQGLFSSGEDPLPPERQARTWVTRFEQDGKVRWSQLPIHASLIFGAPFKVVATLVALYPQGVRCVDDQHMLPLHLAVKYGAEDNVLRLLIGHFPESICTSDINGRLPSQVEGPRNDRTKIMNEVVNVTTKRLQKKQLELQDDLTQQTKLNVELDNRNRELEKKIKRLQTELNLLKGEKGHKKQTTRIQQDDARDHNIERREVTQSETPREPTKSSTFEKRYDDSDVGSKTSTAQNGHSQVSVTKNSAKLEGVGDLASLPGHKKIRRRGFFQGFKSAEVLTYEA